MKDQKQQLNKINIWIIWLWNVWSEVFRILQNNRERYEKIIWKSLNISWVHTRNPQWDKSKDIYENSPEKFKNSQEEIINNSDIVVETIWWIEKAKELIEYSINNWKSVVTANKDLIANYGNELIKFAYDNNVFLNFEASVAWGIPIINALQNWLAGENITSIKWIINWTCNYILTELQNNPKLSYKDVLKEAQDKWYAEKDPTNDVEWIDAAYKLAILSKIWFWKLLKIDEVSKTWISQLDGIDFIYLDILKSKIKLLWVLEKTKTNTLKAIVAPFLIKKDSQLAKIDWVLNAIEVNGENTTNFFTWPWAWWKKLQQHQ